PLGDDHWFLVVRDLLDEPGDAWWDDVTTEATEDRDTLLARVLADAWATAEERMGDDPAGWRWGDLHTATFENQTLGQSGVGLIEAIFNRGGFEPGGTGSVLNATRWRNPESFEVTWGPSMRMIVDLADFSASRSVHTTGQSGHAYHLHYIDQASLWEVGEYHPMRWTRAQVEADLQGRLILVPEE
ncbi:MAG: penicillin acylase family protein, partial [Acidimicrobiia bacterium]